MFSDRWRPFFPEHRTRRLFISGLWKPFYFTGGFSHHYVEWVVDLMQAQLAPSHCFAPLFPLFPLCLVPFKGRVTSLPRPIEVMFGLESWNPSATIAQFFFLTLTHPPASPPGEFSLQILTLFNSLREPPSFSRFPW